MTSTYFDGVLQNGGGGVGVPIGGVILWSGAISAMPAGFHLCDGAAGTRDLTDRFVIHADADIAGTNNVGDSGGAKTHALSTAELSIHTHGVYCRGSSAIGAGTRALLDDGTGDTITRASAAAGGGDAHTNRDLYYALAFIQRLT